MPVVNVTVQTTDDYVFDSDALIQNIANAALLGGSNTATGFTLVNAGANRRFIFVGENLTYDGGGNVTGGTITGWQEITDDTQDPIVEFSGLSEDAVALLAAVEDAAGGDPTALDAITASWQFDFTGNDGNDTFAGGGLADTLMGGEGNDTLEGEGGDDILEGGAGEDSLSGSAGTDFASYANAASGLTVDLATPGNNSDEAVGDTYTSIEGVIGSAFNDTLTGDGNVNDLRGGDGDDFLSGGGGNDVLRGEAGNDNLEGGAGEDSLDGGDGNQDAAQYFNAGAGLVADLANPLNNTGEAAGDTYTSIEGLGGTQFNDTLRGDAGTNALGGYGGADQLDGGAGFDFAWYAGSAIGLTVSLANPGINTGEAAGDTYTSIEGLHGGIHDDTLIGDAGNNLLSGNLGADSLNGGAGIDSADYHFAGGAVVASLANPASNTGEAAGDTYTSIEGLRGTRFNDTLTGDGGNNILRGGLGADQLDGGAGTDFADYFGSSAGLTVSLANPAANTGEAVGDSYTSIEGLRGSNFNDTLIGNSGNNLLRGGLGADQLNGGAGSDFADYFNATAGLTASLANPAANTGEAAGDTYTSIENLRGSGFNDTLIGDGGGNFLQGGAGADSLDGGAGADFADYIGATAGVVANLTNPGANTGEAAGDTYTSIENLRGSNFDDTLVTGAGTNFVRGGLGADQLNGGAGADYADYLGATTGVLASLGNPAANTGEAAGDTYTSIENLRGSDFNDTLIGDGANNLLRGGLGADQLNGGTGSDFADYGGAAAGLVASLLNPAANTGEAAGDTYTSVENLRGSNFNDTLIGGAGTNLLRGGLGADQLDGGAGNDFADYFGATAGVVASLGNPAANAGEAAGDTYTSIENLRGSSFNDTLIGNAGNNFLRGGLGADQLNGGAGNDFADYAGAAAAVVASLANPAANTGEAAGDTYTSIEHLRGTNFNDTLIGDAGTNFLRGALGADQLNGGAGNDFADYLGASAAVVASLANPAANTGEAAGDTYTSIEHLRGSDFNDTLIGNTGNNFLRGGLGADQLDGGAGNDFADYLGASAAVVASLANSAANTGEAAGDTYTSIEHLRGSDFNDTLIGNATTNFLRGGLGADKLNGSTGSDFADYLGAASAVLASLASPGANTGEAAGDTYTSIENLRGSDFNDTLIGDGAVNFLRGGLGADSLDGGAGSDFADYFGAAAAVVASLANPAVNTGEAAGDTYTAIENLRGSDFNDTLIGDGAVNFLRGGLGADSLSGGAGGDYADYLGATAGVRANLASPGTNTGEAVGDTYTSIENLRGSDFSDILIGNGGANTLRGGAGNDTLNGGAGNDLLLGEAGNDRFVYSNNYGLDTVGDYQAGTDTFDLRGVSGLNTYADVQALMSQSGANVIIDFGGGNQLKINNTTIATLDANQGDFLLN
jgi:Ca2+-binding RTX toxin-like protein